MSYRPIIIRGLVLVSSLLVTQNVIAQHKLYDSGKLLESGIAKYDKGQYKEAIADFAAIPEGDTNYRAARYELALAYLSDSSFELAKRTALEGLALYHCDRSREFKLLLGHSYDYLKKPDSAVMVYQQLAKENPNDYQPVYEEGVVYYEGKDYENAIAMFERALLLNPYHYRSHLMLGTCYLQQGRMTEAFIALEASLAVVNNVSVARQSITLLDALTRQTDVAAKPYEKKDQKFAHPLFDEIDQLMNARLAANRSYKVKSVLEEDNLIRVAYMIMDKLKYDASDENFVMQYYVTLFREVFEKDMFDPFVLNIFSNFDIEVVEKYAKKQKGDIREVRLLTYPYLNKILATRKLNLAERLKTKESFYFESQNDLYATGNIETVDNNSAFKSGHARYFRNMVLVAEGNYDDESRKDGEWLYYFPSGLLRLREHYTQGKLTGELAEYHTSGHLKYTARLNEKSERIEQKEYSYNGFLTEHSVLSDGIKTDTSFYRNGQLETVLRMKDDKILDGVYKIYHANGKLRREINAKDGKLHGAYADYYENGQLKQKGNYVKGELNGVVLHYHDNGKTSSQLTYEDGKLEGAFELYDTEGQLTSKGFYRKNHKHGLEQLYSAGREYGSIEFRNGALVAYKFLNPEGRVVDSKEDRDLSVFRTYYPNGVKKSEGPLKNGLYEGVVKIYYSTGALKEKTPYHEDVAEGISTKYFKSGKMSEESNYEKGARNGWYRSYHANGKPKAEGWLINGNKQGVWKYYLANGILDEEAFHEDDELNGPDKEYRANGKLHFIDYYDKGMLVAATYYDTLGNVVSQQNFPLGNGRYKTYHPNGKVSFDCELRNGLFHGPLIKYYLDGQVSEQGNMKYGRKEGEFLIYSLAGKLARRGNFENGKQQGLWQHYDEQGNLTRSINYKEGEEHGSDKIYVHNRLHIEYNMKEGYKDGDQIFYGDSNEVAVVLRYIDHDLVGYTYRGKDGKYVPLVPLDKGTGKLQAFYSNGAKSAEYNFVENIQSGRQVTYYSNGQICEERFLENSDFNGPFRRFFEDGKLLYEAFYKDDQLLGEEKSYDKKGRLVKSVNYFYDTFNGLQQVMDPETGKQTSVYYYYGTPLSTQ